MKDSRRKILNKEFEGAILIKQVEHETKQVEKKRENLEKGHKKEMRNMSADFRKKKNEIEMEQLKLAIGNRVENQ